MHRMALVATKDFTFKGQSYATGDRFELPVGEAYKVITRKQAKRATAKAAAVEAPPVELPPAIEPEPEPQPVVEEEAPEPEPESESAEEEKPKRRRRRQSSYEAETIPHEPSETEWNSE